MKAVVHDRYGPPDVLRLDELPRPEPKDDEVLVRVRATTVNQTDCHMRRARPYMWRFFIGLLRPKRKVLGRELAGEVVAAGAAVTRVRGRGPRVRHALRARTPSSSASGRRVCSRTCRPA